MKFLKNKKVFAILLGGMSTAVILILAYLNLMVSWQLKFGDTLYSPRPVRNDIVVVAVDNTTVSDKELGSYEKWKRDNYAKVLENLNKYNPKVVAFDFFFKSQKDTPTDEMFKNALEKTKNPILMYWGDPTKYDPKGYYVQLKNVYPFELPLAIFSTLENVKIAMAKVIPDGDSVIRKMLPILVNEDGNYYENIPFTIARIVLDAEIKPSTPQISPSEYRLKLKDGKDVVIPLQEGQMIINYATSGGAQSYKTISFSDVYSEKYKENPESIFKDKIVLIGPTAIDFKDTQPAPMIKEYPMTGIEIHANALQTILDQKFLRNLTFAEKAVLIIILAFTAAFTFMFTKIRWSLLYFFGVQIAYWIAAKPTFDNGIILDLVHPFLTVIVTFVAVYLYRYVTEFREKLELQKAFGKYVNPALVKEITEHPESLKLGGEKRNITVMFTDIAHSTTIEENLQPQSVVALLSEYFQAMSEVIMEEGGTVDKFEGDGIMALFGAPVSQPDHAVRACRAAIKMRVRLEQLLKKWKSDPPLPGGETKPQIDFRCGLSSGETTVGNMGSSERFDYTALGDVVNLSSRLEGANKMFETHILMSQKTQEAVKDQFETREIGIIQVIGKKEQIRVFEPLAPKGELPEDALPMLNLYREAIKLYYDRNFTESLAKFDSVLEILPTDGPSKMYRQRCEVLRDFPPKPDWNGVFEMGSK